MTLALTSGVGMPLDMAPQMDNLVDYTVAVDIYSFSLILYEVFVR
jgi:hypothetical protein